MNLQNSLLLESGKTFVAYGDMPCRASMNKRRKNRSGGSAETDVSALSTSAGTSADAPAAEGSAAQGSAALGLSEEEEEEDVEDTRSLANLFALNSHYFLW